MEVVSMKKSLTYWQTVGFFFVSVVGTLLHFLFAWSGENWLVALLAPVNESVWEHMKLVLWPMAVFALAEYANMGKEIGRFWCAKLKGLLTALVLIPAIYYIYTGALGTHWMWFDIAIFFLATGAGFWFETRTLTQGKPCRIPNQVAAGVIVLILVLFAVLTFLPPQIPLFQDPISGTYGFQG